MPTRWNLPTRCNRRSVAMAAALVASAGVWLSAQTQFQFVVSAVDANGSPVTDIRREDVLMSEDGVRQEVVKVEPLAIPMKLTIAVDNGLDSDDAIAHYRSGLTGLVEAMPPDVEVTLISTAPQPRMVVRPTTDRTQILRGISGFAPERSRPRFTDTLVEYSKRLEQEAKDKKAAPYLPVLVMVSTAATETTTYQPDQIQKAVEFLVKRHAKFNAIIVSTRVADVTTVAGLDSSLQSRVALPSTKATNGRYEALALPNRLATLLPEWGRDLAALHAKQIKQFRVTVERTRGGDLKNPQIELARPGLNGTVTVDGYLP
jgi:hypothetical protein